MTFTEIEWHFYAIEQNKRKVSFVELFRLKNLVGELAIPFKIF